MRLAALLPAVVITALLATTAAAQAVRPNIPADAARGKVTATTASLIQIDGKTFRLAPGARILNTRNLTVTPNMVEPGSQARYVLDASGAVKSLWIVDGVERAGTGPVERTTPRPQ